MIAGAAKRILFLSGSETLTAPSVHMLEAGGYQVTTARAAVEARTWLRMNRCDMAIVDLGSPQDGAAQANADLVSELRSGRMGTHGHLLILARHKGAEQLRVLFEAQRLTNFLAVGENDSVDAVELGVTVAKILGKDIFGVERYLAPDARHTVMKVTSSKQKTEIVEAAEDFAKTAGCHPRMAQDISVAVDELITNAVYNAALDSNGRARYAHLSRGVPVNLEPGEEVEVRLACDRRRLCVSARDPFGSLKPQVVMDYLVKCFAGGEDQVDKKEGGAGLGLYYLFNLLNSFVVNISPGKATESIGIVDISKSYRAYTSRGKSFNIFLDGDW